MAVGARRRGNPTSGKGQKAGTVRRSSGPGDHDFGRGGTGTGRPDDDRFGGQVTEMVRRRSGELGAGIISSEMGAVTSQFGWMLRQLSGAESTRSLLSEPSSPEFRVTRTFVRITRTSPGKKGLRACRPGQSIGEPGQEPHGREWTKHSTGPEEE